LEPKTPILGRPVECKEYSSPLIYSFALACAKMVDIAEIFFDKASYNVTGCSVAFASQTQSMVKVSSPSWNGA
jgi:hypothetical protein